MRVRLCLILVALAWNGLPTAMPCPHIQYQHRHECKTCVSLEDAVEYTAVNRMRTPEGIFHPEGWSHNCFRTNTILMGQGVAKIDYDPYVRIMTTKSATVHTPLCRNRVAMRAVLVSKTYPEGVNLNLREVRAEEVGSECWLVHEERSGHLVSTECRHGTTLAVGVTDGPSRFDEVMPELQAEELVAFEPPAQPEGPWTKVTTPKKKNRRSSGGMDKFQLKWSNASQLHNAFQSMPKEWGPDQVEENPVEGSMDIMGTDVDEEACEIPES
jgi:hypothetical protein